MHLVCCSWLESLNVRSSSSWFHYFACLLLYFIFKQFVKLVDEFGSLLRYLRTSYRTCLSANLISSLLRCHVVESDICVMNVKSTEKHGQGKSRSTTTPLRETDSDQYNGCITCSVSPNPGHPYQGWWPQGTQSSPISSFYTRAWWPVSIENFIGGKCRDWALQCTLELKGLRNQVWMDEHTYMESNMTCNGQNCFMFYWISCQAHHKEGV